MTRTLGLAVLVFGVSACHHSKGMHLADGGAVDGETTGGDSAPAGSTQDTSALVDSGVLPDATLAAGQGVESVRFTVSYGECGGFCQHTLLVRANGAGLLTSSNNSVPRRSVEETLALDPAVSAKILDAAAQALASPWESRYGCPDCADQGAYHLEVVANGTIRETTLDPEPAERPSFFAPLVAAVLPVLEAHPYPRSICALSPANCTPGQVSLVLGLNAEGALEPTWFNDLEHSIFLAGCSTVTFERIENGVVTWSGPAAECVSEGIAHALTFKDLWTDIALGTKGKPGTYRAKGTYYQGCAWGKPISQAGCTSKVSVTSNDVVVAQ